MRKAMKQKTTNFDKMDELVLRKLVVGLMQI